MRDFRIVQARSSLPVFSVSPIRGFAPASIVVLGEGFNGSVEVLYNGIQATEIAVASSTRLIVRIPPSQVGKDLTDLLVFTERPTLSGDASLSLELSLPPKIVQGIDRLVQSWMMIFLTTPGSDVFSPQSGGGARSIIGSTTDKNQKSAGADLAISIQRTESELIKLQSATKGLPPEEKLLSSSLESLMVDEATGILSARVQLRNMVSQAAQITLG